MLGDAAGGRVAVLLYPSTVWIARGHVGMDGYGIYGFVLVFPGVW